MDCIDDDPLESSSIGDLQKVESVHNLLEDGWFFGELLSSSRKPKTMPRCFSDPSPNFSQEIAAANHHLMRAPSLPPCIGGRRSDSDMNKLLSRQLSDCKGNNNKIIEQKQKQKHKLLLRTPSLPPCIGREKEEDEEENECDITMSKLIRQAMPHTSKASRPPRNCKIETIETMKETKKSKQRNLRKSMSNLESQMQDLKDLDLNPSNKSRRRPYLSESWHGRSCAPPPIPIWATKDSTQHIKAQLKCWARAVASNVR